MITVFYLLIGVLALLGLVQAQDPPTTPTPRPTGGDAPGRSGNTQTTTPGQNSTPAPTSTGDANAQTQSVSMFNDQIWLMDLYAQDGNNLARFPAPIASNNAVPQSVPLPQLNNFLQIENDAIFEWLQRLTPEEYAQLTPAIQLSVVDLENEKTINIPLSTNSDIETGLASEYWYANKTVGLKSLSMKLDGNNNPVGGKIYNIKLRLLFDSANTFFGVIPGTDGVKYSEVLRVQGPSGARMNNFKLKLSIYYDGPSELVEKYRLNSPGQVFSTYLNLLMSSFSMEENYQTTVEASFQGFEESLFSNASLFDWLRLNLQEKFEEISRRLRDFRAQKESDLQDLEQQRKRIVEDAGFSLDAIASEQPPEGSLTNLEVAQEAFNNKVGEILEGLERSRTQEEGALPIRNVPGGLGGMGEPVPVIDESALDEQRQRYQTLQTTFQGLDALGITTIRPPEIQFNKPFSELSEDEIQAMADYVDSGEFLNESARMQIQTRVADQLRTGKPLGSELDSGARTRLSEFQKLILSGGPGSFESLSERRAAADLRGSITEGIDEILKELAEQEQQAIAERENVRMTEIRIALEETFFNPNNSLTEFYKFEITADQVRNYIFHINTLEITDFLLDPPENTSRESGDASHTSPSDSNNVRSGTEGAYAHSQEIIEQILNLEKRINDYEDQIATDQEADENLTPLDALPPLRRAVAEEKREERRQNLERQSTILAKLREDLQAKRTELANLSKNLEVIGSIPELEERLNHFRYIEYIYLGDLVSLIMNRLQKLAENATKAQKNALRKTLILLTQLKLKKFSPDRSSANWQEVPLYKFPISMVQLQKLLADKLYGTGKNSYTIFEFINDISERIINLSMQRKNRLTNAPSSAEQTFAVKFIPVPLIEAGNGGGYKLASTTADDEARIRHGIITIPRDSAQGNYAGSDEAGNLASKIPHIYMGGQAKGVLKSIKVAEIDDDSMRKVSMERARGTDTQGYIPMFFQSELTLVGTPFFHLGTYYFLDPVGLDLSGTSSWFYLKGHYQVIELEHVYSLSTGYQTLVKGIYTPRQSNKASHPTVNIVDGQLASRIL